MSATTYAETFEEGPGGWCGWKSNAAGPRPLEWRPGRVTSRSPWWIDYNHAPPGAGYMHLLFALNTHGPQGEVTNEVGGPNRFIAGGHPTDFTDAAVTIRVSGELSAQGAELMVLLQGTVDGIISGWLCAGQPFHVSQEMTDQTIALAPDPDQWRALGTRPERADMYGVKPLRDVLAGVDANIMLVLFPLDIAPMGPLDGDPHVLRPERDYPVWRHKLPEGYVSLDSVRIRFG